MSLYPKEQLTPRRYCRARSESLRAPHTPRRTQVTEFAGASHADRNQVKECVQPKVRTALVVRRVRRVRTLTRTRRERWQAMLAGTVSKTILQCIARAPRPPAVRPALRRMGGGAHDHDHPHVRVLPSAFSFESNLCAMLGCMNCDTWLTLIQSICG